MKGDNNSNIKIHFIIPFIAILILEFIGILYLKSFCYIIIWFLMVYDFIFIRH